MSDTDVQVKFGGNTSELDQASNKAVSDIEAVGKTAGGLGGVFSQLKSSVQSFTSAIKGGWAEGWAKGMEEAKTAAEHAKEGIAETAVEATGFGELVKGLIPGLAALGATLSVPAIIEFGKGMGEVAIELERTGAQPGMSAQELSRWQGVAVATGNSTEVLSTSAKRLERSMVAAANGGKQQSAMFKALGIDLTKTKTTSEALLAVSDGFAKMADGPKKTAIALGLMGRSGAEMIPTLNEGSDAVKEMMKTADEMGYTVSDKFMAAGMAVDEASDTMTLGLEGVRRTLFSELGPAIANVMEWMNGLIEDFMESYRTGGFAKTMIDAISIAFKTMATVIVTVVAGFQELWHIGVAALQGILGTAYSVGTALSKLLSGDFSGMKEAWANGMKATGSAMRDQGEQALAIGQKYRTSIQKLWTDAIPKAHPRGTPPSTDLNVPGLGPKGPKDDSAAKARKLAEERLKNEIEDLNYKQDLEKENYEAQMALEQQKLDKLKAFYGEDSREYIKELRNKEKMERQHQQELVKLAQQRIVATQQIELSKIDTQTQVNNIELQTQRDHLSTLESMGMVSNAKRIAAQRQFAAQEIAIQTDSENQQYKTKYDSIQQQLQLPHLLKDDAIRLNRDLEQLEQDHQNRMTIIRANAAASAAKLNDEAAQATLNKWKNIVDPIGNAFDGFLQSMETRSATFGQALLRMGDQILQSFVSMGVKALAHWVSMELAKTSATSAGVAMRTSTEAAGAATSTSISAVSAIKQIAHKAAVAAAGAYAAIAGIPIVGPILAPAAAAAALFGVYKLGQAIFSAKDGEGEVPYDGATYQLHKKEMVLPAKFANPLRNMLTTPQLSGLGTATSSAGTELRKQMTTNSANANFYYQPTHNNQDVSLDKLLRSEGSTLRKWFRNEVRNNKFGMLGEPA